MKVHKVIHDGQKKFCAIVETGEFYMNGRVKQKRFFHSLRNEAVAKAMDYLADKDGQPKKTINLDIYPIYKVYEDLLEDWEMKVSQKEKAYKREDKKKKKNTLSEDTKNRYEESVVALWKIVDKNTNIHTITKRWVDKFIKNLVMNYTDSHAYRVYSRFGSYNVKSRAT